MASESGSNRFRALKLLGLFAIIALGVFVGSLLSFKSGLTDVRNQTTLSKNKLFNDTQLEAGQTLPPLTAYDANGNDVALAHRLRDGYTVLAAVSSSCGPCLDLYDSLTVWQFGNKPDRQIILLTEDLDYFGKDPGVTTLGITDDLAETVGIRVFPTIIVVAPDGEVRLISSGFGRKLTRDRLAEALGL